LRPDYDLLIVGGGPAGAAAAIAARRSKLRTLLIEREPRGRARPCAGWIGPAGVELCRTCGLSAAKAGAGTFKGVRLFSWDLKRSTVVAEAGLTGWIVDRREFDPALRRCAESAGGEILLGTACEAVTIAEDRVTLSLSDGRKVAGQVLILADGLDSRLAHSANLLAAGDLPRVPHAVLVELEAKADEFGVDVVLGSHRDGVLATIVRAASRLRFSLLTREARSQAANRVTAFLQAAQSAGLLPRAPLGTPTIERSPAGLALELETHVGKRCLIVGDAGGFVAAFSNEGIYPAMKSGWIAAETAARALKLPVLQDELASFGAAWRTQLADYLRMPNTDLSLLIPLVFGTRQMSLRVARAFLLGQPF
jgi:flavin-dependent dehydrogenase